MWQQVIFTLDPATKKATATKAKKEGLTLKAVYTFLTQAYLDGKIKIGAIPVTEDEYDSDPATYSHLDANLQPQEILDYIKTL